MEEENKNKVAASLARNLCRPPGPAAAFRPPGEDAMYMPRRDLWNCAPRLLIAAQVLYGLVSTPAVRAKYPRLGFDIQALFQQAGELENPVALMRDWFAGMVDGGEEDRAEALGTYALCFLLSTAAHMAVDPLMSMACGAPAAPVSDAEWVEALAAQSMLALLGPGSEDAERALAALRLKSRSAAALPVAMARSTDVELARLTSAVDEAILAFYGSKGADDGS